MDTKFEKTPSQGNNDPAAEAAERIIGTKKRKMVAALVGGVIAAGATLGVAGKALSNGNDNEPSFGPSDTTIENTIDITASPSVTEESVVTEVTEAAEASPETPENPLFEEMKQESYEEFKQRDEAQQYSYMMGILEERSYDIGVLSELTGVEMPKMTKDISAEDLLIYRDFILSLLYTTPYSETHDSIAEPLTEDEIKKQIMASGINNDTDVDWLLQRIKEAGYNEGAPITFMENSIFKDEVTSDVVDGDKREIRLVDGVSGEPYVGYYVWLPESEYGSGAWIPGVQY